MNQILIKTVETTPLISVIGAQIRMRECISELKGNIRRLSRENLVSKIQEK